jgi:hypothetical protein
MKTRSLAWLILISVATAPHSVLAEDDPKAPTTLGAPQGQTNSTPALQSTSARSAGSTKEKPAVSSELSGWTADVAKLTEARMDEDIIYSFIDGSGTFNLDAEQIIHLRQKGVPPQFIVAMIQHDADVTSGNRPLTISSTPSTRPSIQFVLVPKDSLKETKTSAPPSASGNENRSIEAQSVYDDVLRFVDWETLSAIQNDSGASSASAPEKNKGLYRVRQPYSEQVTPPILIFKAASVTPNTYLIQFSP